MSGDATAFVSTPLGGSWSWHPKIAPATWHWYAGATKACRVHHEDLIDVMGSAEKEVTMRDYAITFAFLTMQMQWQRNADTSKRFSVHNEDLIDIEGSAEKVISVGGYATASAFLPLEAIWQWDGEAAAISRVHNEELIAPLLCLPHHIVWIGRIEGGAEKEISMGCYAAAFSVPAREAVRHWDAGANKLLSVHHKYLIDVEGSAEQEAQIPMGGDATATFWRERAAVWIEG